jgi:NAD(P)-dependent dehydrogenase (short-subunit alcohol dehydrogenase family)
MDGRLIIVTGTSRGIGQGIAQFLAQEGADVAGVDWHEGDETRELAGERFVHFRGDVSSADDVARVFAEIDAAYGRAPWGLVCVAGIAPEVDFLDTTPEVFDAVMGVNVRGPFLCGQQAGRRMRDAGGGRIVNIASTASVQSWAQQSVYGTSKGAVLLLTRNMANELARFGITVNAVGPGTITTPLAANVLNNPDWVAAELGTTPIKRFGTPRDIAVGVRFFLQPEAEWVTGQTLYVDGGFLACGGPWLESFEGHVSIER